MTRIMAAVFCLIVFSSMIHAQTDAQVPASSNGQTTYGELENEFVLKVKKYLVKQRELFDSKEYKSLRKARDNKGIRKLMSVLVHPRREFTPRFQTLAETHVGKKSEVPILLWLVKNSREAKIVEESSMAIIERHPEGDATWQLIQGWTDLMSLREKRDRVLDAIITKSKNKHAVAEAIWVKAYMSRDKKKEADAKALILEKYPDSTPALRYRSEEFKKTKLQIGMKAPEVVGEDIDGTKFKLSDYRGKVVLFDFWGDW